MAALARISRRRLPFAASLLSSPFSSSSSSASSSSSRFSSNCFKLHHSVSSPSQPIEQRLFSSASSSSTSSTMSAQPFLDTLVTRRTYYQLGKELSVSTDRIQEIVKHAILHVPSSFNAQVTRVLILFGAEHDKLWDTTLEILKAIVPAEGFASTEKRIGGFKGAAATVLFFNDLPTISAQQEQYKLYADRFPGWASESTAMHQYAVWTAIVAEGLGANLQHYNPLIDQKIQETWGVPATWELKAQLVIGDRGDSQPGPKSFKEVEGERLIVKGL